MGLLELYDYYYSLRDKRVDGWLLMDSPVPTLVFIAMYLTFVKFVPGMMKGREPFQLVTLMRVYNLFIVLLCLWMFLEFAYVAYMADMGFTCPPMDYSDDYYALRMARVCWWYYFSKVIEFLDTVIFILRKKQDQVTFLHVYHHATMFPFWWVGVRWVPGGPAYFGAMINSLIHVMMYFYYFLAAMGPNYKKYLWWKKYMTKMQLTQFYTALVHTTIVLYNVRRGSCVFPEWMGWGLILYLFSMIGLFSAFYIRAYKRGESTPRAKEPILAPQPYRDV